MNNYYKVALGISGMRKDQDSPRVIDVISLAVERDLNVGINVWRNKRRRGYEVNIRIGALKNPLSCSICDQFIREHDFLNDRSILNDKIVDGIEEACRRKRGA